jgi:FAD/FMN-containing dehydrogenase
MPASGFEVRVMQINSWGGMAGEVATLSQPFFSSEFDGLLRRVNGSATAKRLVIGNLRSYGDQVLCPDGHYVQTTRCDRVLSIEPDSDLVTAESGVSVDALQKRLAPLGYILPVTPGTAFLTVGGAIANDVHGKNHHVAGTFGRFVERFELVRTTGEKFICSRHENSDWFAATIGGMGLTGAITWARLKLRRIDSPLLSVNSHRFGKLADFFSLDAEYKDKHEYTVAWIDCLAKGTSLGRGIFSVADHVSNDCRDWGESQARSRFSVPFSVPVSPINRLTLTLMNTLYWRSHRTGLRRIHCKGWLYPLDSIQHWNRLYGMRGFRQFQCVVPAANAHAAIAEMLQTTSAAGQGSFLAVLKNFGDKPSPGLLSFPMPGTTLALDFANRGVHTRDLLFRLYEITAAAGGRLYLAKDGCSPADSLERGYSNLQRFRPFIDPGIGSVQARRLQLIA